MKPIQLSKHVAAPVARVFETHTDLSRAAERIEGIVRLEILTDGPVGQDTRFRETRVMFKKETTEEMEISHFDAPNSYTVHGESCGTEFETTFRFTPEGDGTRVDMTVVARALTLFAKLMSPLGALMAGSMRKMMDKDLEDLKRATEAQD